MLYEIIGIVRTHKPKRPSNMDEVKEIVLAAGQHILRNKGVIRDVRNWGVFHLPRPASLADEIYRKGHYFVLRFDSSVGVQEHVSNVLKQDPRVIRASSVKLGDGQLSTLSRLTDIKWNEPEM